ncbi:MAG: peptidase MA family metallohydrolase [Terriglobales bacterium]
MRVPVILFITLALAAQAETIHLKSGRTILASNVREKDGRIEWEVGDNTYSIAKSLVERIDTGGAPVVSRGGAREIEVAPPTERLEHAEELSGRVVVQGRVDPGALAAVEKEGFPENSAAAYYAAAEYEYSHGNLEQSRIYLERALSFTPNNSIIVDNYAYVLLVLGKTEEGLSQAGRATRMAPNSADAFKILGMAYYKSDKTEEAIRAWKRSLELRPDSSVRQYLRKAEREQTAESQFGQEETGHFTLRFEGRQSSAALRQEILATLEAHYSELAGALGASPRASIPVILYTGQAFFDVTQAPGWSGAINDGKLRIPIEGVSSVTPELSRVLKHELAHSFIADITHNRCPTWLNEGVAQALEPKSSAAHGRALARLFTSGSQTPLNALEGPFNRFSTQQAVVAYAESLAAVEYIRDNYGMSDVVRILERIGQGSSTEAALRATIHSGYASLEEEIGRYLKKVYGA